MIADKLKLSPEQRGTSKGVLDAALKQLSDLRELTLASELAIIQDAETKFEAGLTAEQKQAFAPMKIKPKDITLDLLLVTPSQSAAKTAKTP